MADSYHENMRVTPGTGKVKQVAQTGPPPPVGEPQMSSMNMIKFFVMAANKDIEDVGLARPLTTKDLDNLDHDTFVKLLVYLVTSPGLYTPEQILGKTEVLLGVKQAGFPGIEYDATLDHIYHAVRGLFSESDDRFTYALLLKPQTNPKMAKMVIEYLIRFVVLTEACSEAFEEIKAEVTAEHFRRTELHKQIDEVNARIAAKTADMEEKRAALPSLQERLNEMNVELAREEDVVADLEKEVAKYKAIYDAKEQEKLRLERQLEEVQEHRARMEAQVVANPEVIQMQHKYESEKLRALIQEREEVGAKLDAMTLEDQQMDELVTRGEQLLQRMEECIANMTEVATMVHEQRAVDEELKSYEVGLKSIVTNLRHLTLTRDKVKGQTERELVDMRSRLTATENELQNMRAKAEAMKEEWFVGEKRKLEISEEINGVISENRCKMERLARNEHWLTVEFPGEMDSFARQVAELLKEFNEQLLLADGQLP